MTKDSRKDDKVFLKVVTELNESEFPVVELLFLDLKHRE